MLVTTASGVILDKNNTLRMRAKELDPVRQRYAALNEQEKRVTLPDPASAQPPRRAVPQPPKNGLILRGYCTYMGVDEDQNYVRDPQYYYKENPDAWAAETQSDMLWLTESEWRSLIPDPQTPGTRLEVPHEIQRRFYTTIGIDYMEGSVNALPLRSSSMFLLIQHIKGDLIQLTLNGTASLGQARHHETRTEARTRGSDLTIEGHLSYNRKTQRFSRFDIAGIGQAWGNKMNYTRRAIRIPGDTWIYGIATELVTGRTPYDITPPYNLLHYASGMKYYQ